MIFKTTYHEVCLKVVFNNEEQMFIKKNKLKNWVFLEREPPADVKVSESNQHKWYILVKDLLRRKEDRYLTESPIEANQYENQLLEKLAILKDAIANNQTSSSKTFEL